jgi:hypothetical protein
VSPGTPGFEDFAGNVSKKKENALTEAHKICAFVPIQKI